MAQKLRTPRVMLSSTVEDLGDIRQRAHKICRNLELDIVSMEDNVAVADSVRGYSINLVDDADVYVGIVAQNAGTKPADDELHYTHLEYQRALLEKLPRLLFLFTVDDETALEGPVADLRKRMLADDGAVAAFFDNVNDFEVKMHSSLVKFIESWREARGINVDQTELNVDPITVEQGDAINIFVSGPDGILNSTCVRFQDREIDLDQDGYGQAIAETTGVHSVELLLKTDDTERELRSESVTVTYPGGRLVDLAIGGSFIALVVWVMAGFMHPQVLNAPPNTEELRHFKNDYLGHILIGGTVAVAFALRVVWKKIRQSLGAVIVPIDEQWRSHRWWITTLVTITMAYGAYLNVDIIASNTAVWWWSEDARDSTPWFVAGAYFLVALVPILLLLTRMILALNKAVHIPTELPSFNPASDDGHFGLAWLGNTVIGFLAVASVPVSLAASWFFYTNEVVGLGTPIAVMICVAIIGTLAAIPLQEIHVRLEGQRFRARQMQEAKLNKLMGVLEAALNNREREERTKEIDACQLRVQAIKQASSIAMSRFGIVCGVILCINLVVPVVLLFM